MIVTTTSTVEGRPVSEYKGIVSGTAIHGVNVGKDFKALGRNLVGNFECLEADVGANGGDQVRLFRGVAAKLLDRGLDHFQHHTAPTRVGRWKGSK